MEALSAASVALLTIYDMCKAVDRGMAISGVRLMEKHGGRVGVLWRSSFRPLKINNVLIFMSVQCNLQFSKNTLNTPWH